MIRMKLHHEPVMRRLNRGLVSAVSKAEDRVRLVDGHVVAAAARWRSALAPELVAPIRVQSVEIGL